MQYPHNRQENFLIVDGNNLLYSSYHVSQKLPWRMKKGVVFFFLRVLISILKKDNYQKLLIVFDGGGINWRKSFLPRYKAQREGMPKELCEQMKSLKILLERINLAYLQLVDHEADDVIASFVKQSQEMFPKVTFDIFTQDKDMLQLINSNTNILKYINGKITLYNLEHFRQEYNFSPLNYIDYLSLIGDGVDNIEGVKGVGPVGAKKLVQQFSTVEKIYQKIMELPENTRGLLEKNQEIVFRNKRIISLTTNIFLPAEKYKDCHFCWKDWKNNFKLYQFCQANSFKSILQLLNSQKKGFKLT